VADEVRAQVREQRVDDVYDMWVRDHIDAADITVDPSIGTWQPQPARVEPVLVDDRAT
jgi:hypothetical protein